MDETAHMQDVNLVILYMLEGTFWLDAPQLYVDSEYRNYPKY